MSRELKFRAWDGEQMHNDVVPWQWDFVISRAWHRCEKSTGQGILGSGGKTGEFLVPGISFKELMQFTGLKDKSGKEIYEGDILSYWAKPEGYPLSNEKEYRIVVEWKSMANHTFLWGHLKYEVIGDIHRNPELIKR